MKIFDKWRKQRRERRDSKAFDRGYAWAATGLLRGSFEIDTYNKIMHRTFTNEHVAFDIGARQACADALAIEEKFAEIFTETAEKFKNKKFEIFG